MERKSIHLAALALALGAVAVSAASEERCPAAAADCVQQMAEELRDKGWIGIKVGYDEASDSVSVKKVFPDSPAETAKLRPGDRLLSLNGVPYTRQNEKRIKAVYASLRPGETATFAVARGEESLSIDVGVAPLPETLIAQWIGQHLLQKHADPASARGD